MTPEMIEAMMPLLSKQERKEADRLILMLLADERPRCHPIDTLGPGMTWREWCASYVPQAMSHPFSFAHEQMWDWTEELKRGVRPKALIAAINRRGGKTTTMRAVVIRTCVKATRSFWLYVCRTQKDADRHVGSIGRRMEQMGVKRQMSVHGFAVGWNASMLRTENGFTILAFGLADAASRGVNLDDQRPDAVALDDIDVLGETLYMIDKKKDVLAATVIPSGANDCAFAFVQNPIHANSIMSQVLDGRFDILMNRITVGPVPALLDMEWQYYIDEENRQRARIVSGIPTWEGLSLQTCQDEIDAEGVGVFLREFQHDVYRVGVFFTNWDKARHVRRPGIPEGPCRVCGGLPGRIETCRECGATGMHYPAPWPIPSWWKLVGGLDYGRSSKNPFAFVLFAIDDNDNYYAVDEIYQAQLSPEEQAEKIIALLKPYGRPLRDVPIWCGPEIFPGKEPAVPVMGAACGGKVLTPGWSMFAQNGEHVSDIYIKAGLNVVPAVGANTANERVNGWAAVNKMLDKIEGFIAYEGRVPNLIRTFPVLPVSPNNPEDVDSSSDDHIADGCRYVARNRIAVAARPIGSRVSGSQAYIAAALEKRRKELSQKRKW